MANQNNHSVAAQMVSTITENQSMALMAPRFMVNRPNAAITARGGSNGSNWLWSGAGWHSAKMASMATKVSGTTMCRTWCWRRQAYTAQPAKGQAGQKNQTPTRKKNFSDNRLGQPICVWFHASQPFSGVC